MRERDRPREASADLSIFPAEPVGPTLRWGTSILVNWVSLSVFASEAKQSHLRGACFGLRPHSADTASSPGAVLPEDFSFDDHLICFYCAQYSIPRSLLSTSHSLTRCRSMLVSIWVGEIRRALLSS
jgi:hypothetical protein